MATRLTPDGIAFTSTEETIGTDTSTVWVPAHVEDGTGVTLVILAHGVGGDHTHIEGDMIRPLGHACMARGWVAVSPALHGNSWANDQGMTDLADVHAWADARWNVERVILHGTSAGAWTVAAAVATQAVPDIVGVVTIDGVLNPELFYAINAWAAATMNTAWGVTNRTEFAAAIVGRDPAKDSPALWHGSWFVAASPADTTVPKDIHSDVFVGRMTDPEHDVTYTETAARHVEAPNFLYDQTFAWLDVRAPAYSGGAPVDPEEPPPPGAASNLRDTSGNPVALLRTDGTPVALSPA